MNDDMLVLKSASASDFFSLPFGSVFRIDPGWGLHVDPKVVPSKISDSGEWGALNHASLLLSRRFPNRARQYIHHLPKTMTQPMVHEAMYMFGEELALAATRRFRESVVAEGDVEMGFLITHLRIERWREALLWVWAVGKMGNLAENEQGVWSSKAREELRSMLGLGHLSLGDVMISRAERDTLRDMETVFQHLGHDAPQSTSYSFSSMDGHLPHFSMAGPEYQNGVCAINLKNCFGQDFLEGKDEDASKIFKKLAFEAGVCGDCGKPRFRESVVD